MTPVKKCSHNSMINKYTCLRGEYSVEVPSTVEEFDALAKRNGACLDAAIRQVIYHKLQGDVREDIVGACEKSFDFPRLEVDTGKKRKDGTAILVDEDADAYVKRLFADRNWDLEAPPKEYMDLVSALPVTFDPSAAVRESKSKVLPKMYLEAAKRIITNNNQANWAGRLGLTLTGDNEADAVAIGWAIKKVEDEKRRAAEAAAKATYA